MSETEEPQRPADPPAGAEDCEDEVAAVERGEEKERGSRSEEVERAREREEQAAEG